MSTSDWVCVGSTAEAESFFAGMAPGEVAFVTDGKLRKAARDEFLSLWAHAAHRAFTTARAALATDDCTVSYDAGWHRDDQAVRATVTAPDGRTASAASSLLPRMRLVA